MKRFIFLIPIGVALLVLTGIVAAQSSPSTRTQSTAPTSDVAAPSAGSIVSTTFTYQGLIKQSGSPINGSCDLAFRLFNASSSGSQIASAITHTVSITNGLFALGLNFGNGSVFAADARWLDIRMRCPAGGGSFTTLNPRQALTPAPYALALPGLRTEPNAISPNIVGGSISNTIGGGSDASAILSGGNITYPNSVSGGEGNVIAGGHLNGIVGSVSAFIGGGFSNTILSREGVIAGGNGNIVLGDDAAIAGGYRNQAIGDKSFVGGGLGNIAYGPYSTIPGGDQNQALGYYSLAAGLGARAVGNGTFVWADSNPATYASSANDQFAIRASGGVSLAVNANYTKTINVGERYRDNAIVAWAKIDGPTGLVQNAQTASFGIAATRRIAAGRYGITTTASASLNFNLVPIANAEIDSAPSGAANVRIVSINQISPNYFEVYINDGTFALVDNDFTVIVTGR